MNETTLDCNAPRAFCLTLLADEACRKAVQIESAKASQKIQAFVQFNMSGRPNDLQVLQRKVQNASPALVPGRYMQDTYAGSDLTPTLQTGLQNQGVYHCEHWIPFINVEIYQLHTRSLCLPKLTESRSGTRLQTTGVLLFKLLLMLVELLVVLLQALILGGLLNFPSARGMTEMVSICILHLPNP